MINQKPFQVRWGDVSPVPNTELCFRREVPACRNARLHIIAKDLYNLYINGRFVCYGPARTAKGYCREDVIDLSDRLTETVNTVCVYVHSVYAGTLSFCLEKPLFGAKLYAGETLIAQTDDFACYPMTDVVREVERMSRQRGFCEVYTAAVSREKNDFSGMTPLVTKTVDPPLVIERGVSFSENTVLPYTAFKSGPVSLTESEITEKRFARMPDFGDRFSGYARQQCKVLLARELLTMDYSDRVESTDYIYTIYKSDATHSGKIEICITVTAQTTLWVTYDDLLIDGIVRFDREHITHGLKWTLEKGTYVLHSREVYSAKYIQIISDRSGDISSVSVISIENADCKPLILPPMNDTLQKIVWAAQNSFRQNAYDILTDCPSRERAGWLCDGYFIGKAEHFFTGANRVEKNMLENFLLYRNEYFAHDGIIPMCYPSHITDGAENIPGWILWYVLELEDYLKRTGDWAFIERHRDRLNDILDYFDGYRNEYGLLEDLEGWVFVEWSKASDFVNGVNIPCNILFAETLRACGELLQCSKWTAESLRVRKSIIDLAFDGTLFCDNLIRENGKLTATQNYSELCQTYAVYFELLPENATFKADFVDCFQHIDSKKKIYPAAMFIGNVLRMMSLYKMGMDELLLYECEKNYAQMAESTGTLWEFFDKSASCNHGFGAVLGPLICGAAERLNRKGKEYEAAQKN